MVRYLPISDQCLGEIRAETWEDQFLQELSENILIGWPEHKDYNPAITHPYISMRDEVTVQDGVVFKGNSVVIPWSLRADMKMKIHSSHLGIEACLQVAREEFPYNKAVASHLSTVKDCLSASLYDKADI